MFRRLFWLVGRVRARASSATRKAPRGGDRRLRGRRVARRDWRDRWAAALAEGRDETIRRELALRDVLAAPTAAAATGR